MSYCKILIYLCLVLNIIHTNTQIPISGMETVYTIDQESSTILYGSIQSGDIIAHSLSIDEGDFVRIFLPGFHISNEIGSPELPQ